MTGADGDARGPIQARLPETSCLPGEALYARRSWARTGGDVRGLVEVRAIEIETHGTGVSSPCGNC